MCTSDCDFQLYTTIIIPRSTRKAAPSPVSAYNAYLVYTLVPYYVYMPIAVSPVQRSTDTFLSLAASKLSAILIEKLSHCRTLWQVSS